jgi:hypothetical protein
MVDRFLSWLGWTLIRMAEPKAIGLYRVVRVRGGFEPQQSYSAGWDGHRFWTPLAVTGYWADPDSFNFGKVTKRPAPVSRAEATQAIGRAKSLNTNGSVLAAATPGSPL